MTTPATRSEPRSTVLLPVPAAEALVGEVRLTHDPVASLGIPAHVTLLFPFVPAARIDDQTIAQLADQLARGPAGGLSLAFDRLGRFPGVAYLALAEPAPVVAWIAALAAAWPEYPPYGGRFTEIVPHLTVAHGEDALLTSIERRLAPALPLRAHVDSASVFLEDSSGRWHERARLPLG
jgi:2'-5' RNA ligase